MLKHIAVFAVSVILGLIVLGLGGSTNPVSTSGSWRVDARDSNAKLITDATTDYGKTKINVTLGYARVNGAVRL
ncbi:MAG: hypothetical protein WAK56_08395, partial [Candidatus Sulfotelmatobacter sp.]